MNYDIKLHMETEFEKDPINYKGSRIASGWVEIESAFKFPVNILRTNDNSRMFVKYPDTKNKDGKYINIVFPVKEELREELNEAIISELHNLLKKGFENPEISNVKVNVLSEEIKIGKMTIKGYATIEISGFIISGITIKESSKGLFVQMPQSKDKHGQYHDMFYGTNKFMQIQISNAVLEAYKGEKKLALEKTNEYKARQYLGKDVEAEKIPKM